MSTSPPPERPRRQASAQVPLLTIRTRPTQSPPALLNRSPPYPIAPRQSARSGCGPRQATPSRPLLPDQGGTVARLLPAGRVSAGGVCVGGAVEFMDGQQRHRVRDLSLSLPAEPGSVYRAVCTSRPCRPRLRTTRLRPSRADRKTPPPGASLYHFHVFRVYRFYRCIIISISWRVACPVVPACRGPGVISIGGTSSVAMIQWYARWPLPRAVGRTSTERRRRPSCRIVPAVLT